MKKQILFFLGDVYRLLIFPIFRLFDSEDCHNLVLRIGEIIERSHLTIAAFRKMFFVGGNSLKSSVAGIYFENPIGLAAGFDYQAQITNLLPAIGFGFGSIGTVTLGKYDGNPRPRLGRLIKSQSLLVNKGFKSPGMKSILSKLSRHSWTVPVGISIGRTNSADLRTNEDAVADIVSSFNLAEASTVPFSYYELNISCPNLISGIEFYSPEKLRALLLAVTALNLSKPIFIKMPIDKTDDEVRVMLDIIIEFPVAGIIIGNLQKDRNHPSLYQDEVAQCQKGSFSGKPCSERSDELIRLAYRTTQGKIVIIGCGGVFTAEDAYRKIRLGASLIQLVTALIYRGPLVPAEICTGLQDLLVRDGFSSVSSAIGVSAKD